MNVHEKKAEIERVKRQLRAFYMIEMRQNCLLLAGQKIGSVGSMGALPGKPLENLVLWQVWVFPPDYTLDRVKKLVDNEAEAINAPSLNWPDVFQRYAVLDLETLSEKEARDRMLTESGWQQEATDKNRGLYRKYQIRNADGSPVPDEASLFVLRVDRPEKDVADRIALAAYAQAVSATHPNLSADLFEYLRSGRVPSQEARVPARYVALRIDLVPSEGTPQDQVRNQHTRQALLNLAQSLEAIDPEYAQSIRRALITNDAGTNIAVP